MNQLLSDNTGNIILASHHLLAGHLQMSALKSALNVIRTRMCANAQPDGSPTEHRLRPLFNATKFS